MSLFYQNEYPGQYDIPVKLLNGNKSVTITANIDTGSWSLFDAKHAANLGIDVTKGYHSYTRTGNEVYYLHRLPIQLGNLRPVIADIYFGSRAGVFSWVKKENLEKGTLGWANNGGLNQFIIDLDVKNIKFTDYSYIHSLPRPVNPYTVIHLSPPRLPKEYKEEILYNQQPYHDITVMGKKIKVAVDTGSTFTIFRPEIADMFGINITGGRKREIRTQTGMLRMYIHDFMVRIGTLRPKKITVNFSESQEIPVNLLGQDTLFRYKVRFMKDRIMYEENPFSFVNKL